MSYDAETAALASLESFPAAAFRPGADATREECGFFLALALVHSDLKDLVLGQLLLSELPSPDRNSPSAALGQRGGIETHFLRSLIGLLHEFLELLRSHPDVLDGPLFKEVHRLCPRSAKQSWRAIIAAADGSISSDPLARALFFVRNKISFHYDVKELQRGFELAFNSPRYGAPMLSRGTNLQESRFYFADAAAQAYLHSKTGGDGPTPVFSWSTGLSGQVNSALFWLILKFIEVRGFRSRTGVCSIRPRLPFEEVPA